MHRPLMAHLSIFMRYNLIIKEKNRRFPVFGVFCFSISEFRYFWFISATSLVHMYAKKYYKKIKRNCSIGDCLVVRRVPQNIHIYKLKNVRGLIKYYIKQKVFFKIDFYCENKKETFKWFLIVLLSGVVGEYDNWKGVLYA